MRKFLKVKITEIYRIVVFMLLVIKKNSEISDSRLYSYRKGFSKSVMVPIGLWKLCKIKVAFIEKGAKINQDYYCSHVLASLTPEMDNLAGNDYVFMQDGARSHTAKATAESFSSHLPEFIKRDSWAPNSPDLTPMGYYVWSLLESMVYVIKITDIAQCIIDCWKEISQEEINKATDAFQRILRKVIKANGDHIEKIKS